MLLPPGPFAATAPAAGTTGSGGDTVSLSAENDAPPPIPGTALLRQIPRRAGSFLSSRRRIRLRPPSRPPLLRQSPLRRRSCHSSTRQSSRRPSAMTPKAVLSPAGSGRSRADRVHGAHPPKAVLVRQDLTALAGRTCRVCRVAGGRIDRGAAPAGAPSGVGNPSQVAVERRVGRRAGASPPGLPGAGRGWNTRCLSSPHSDGTSTRQTEPMPDDLIGTTLPLRRRSERGHSPPGVEVADRLSTGSASVPHAGPRP
jgi:hypothetical protein